MSHKANTELPEAKPSCDNCVHWTGKKGWWEHCWRKERFDKLPTIRICDQYQKWIHWISPLERQNLNAVRDSLPVVSEPVLEDSGGEDHHQPDWTSF